MSQFVEEEKHGPESGLKAADTVSFTHSELIHKAGSQKEGIQIIPGLGSHTRRKKFFHQ